jgi:adenylyltransferase/sulfurtransferase
LARQNILLGKVPTTPTIASIIGAMQSQEALKLINNMPIEPGKVTHFNGMVNEMHTTAYSPREDCESHWTYGEVTELPARAERTTLDDILRIACADLGLNAVVELDQELVTKLECKNCHTMEETLKPLSEVTFESGHCPICGELREASMTHLITGEETFLHRTLASVGVPPLHIIRAHNGVEYRFYELSADLPDTLHFQDYGSTLKIEGKKQPRIRIKDVIQVKVAKETPMAIKEAPVLKVRSNRVRLRD